MKISSRMKSTTTTNKKILSMIIKFKSTINTPTLSMDAIKTTPETVVPIHFHPEYKNIE